MSAAERNPYQSPTRGPRWENTSGSSGQPGGTFGTAPRFGPTTQAGRPSAGARYLGTSYGYSAKGTGGVVSSTGARGGYASLAQARAYQPSGGAPAPRSKTPAPVRNPDGSAATANTIPARRAMTPPSRAPPQYGTVTDAAVGGPARRTTAALKGTGPSRQPNPSGGPRLGTADRMVTARTPGRLRPSGQTPGTTPSPPRQDIKRPYTGPNSKITTRTPRLAYADSPAAAVRTVHHPSSTAGGSSPSISSRPTVPGGRFQEPGDDWLANYEKSSMGVLRELERVLGGLVQLGGGTSAKAVEAGAPPLQLPTKAERRTAAAGASASGQPSNPHMGHSHGPAGGNLGTDMTLPGVLGGANVDANQQTAGSARPNHPAAWAEFISGPGPSTGPGALTAAQLPTARPPTAFAAAAGGEAAAVAGGFRSAALPNGPGAMTGAAAHGTVTAGQGIPHPAISGVVSPPGLAAGLPLSISAPPVIGATQSGSIAVAMPSAPLSLPAGAMSELWSVLQTCSQTTSRLMADLAAARREAELANERAEEADSLARAFQQQLISRQKNAASWQQAIVEMEEREAAARQQLAEAQTRCNEQEQRAQQAERVAATAQMRLERFMSQQAPKPQPDGADAAAVPPNPDPQLQQQLEHMQADLAAARTRATRAELELAVARNKALIAQQEMAAEEERARRAAVTAKAAREELGRTRTALEMMGLDHDRLQTQLEVLRGKVRDSVQGPRGPTQPDLIAASNSRPPHHSPLAVPATTSSRAGGPRQIPASSPAGPSGAAAAAAASPRQVMARPIQAPTPSGAAERRQHRRAHHADRDDTDSSYWSSRSDGRADRHDDVGAAASGVDGPGSSRARLAGPGRREVAPDTAPPAALTDGPSAPQRPRSGSLLLVPPGELPVDRSASVRYGHRMVMRQRSRSQDLGRAGSPSRPGGLSPWRRDNAELVGASGDTSADPSVAARVAARSRSPRTMSGSHDGVVRRLNLEAAEHSDGSADARPADGRGITAPTAPRSLAGRQARRSTLTISSDDDDDDDEDDGDKNEDVEGSGRRLDSRPVSRSGSVATASTSSVQRSAAGMPEEMLPLSRTPSSGVRRRLSIHQTSQSSLSRAVQPVVPAAPPPNSAGGAGAGGAEAAGEAPTPAGRAPPAAAPEPKRADQPPAAGKTLAWQQPGSGSSRPAPGQPSELPGPASEPRVAVTAAAGGSSQAGPSAPPRHLQAALQQQQTGPGDRMSVSLADLRRQMAAATAAGASDAMQRQRSLSFGLRGNSLAEQTAATVAAGSGTTPDTTVQKDANRSTLTRQQSLAPAQHPPPQQAPGHQNQAAPSQGQASRLHPSTSTPPPAPALSTGGPKVLTTLSEPLPPLEQCNSPPDRPRHDGGGAATSPARSPLGPSISLNLQPSHLGAASAVARAGAADSAASAPGLSTAPRGPALNETAPQRPSAGALPPTPSRLGTVAADIGLPRGYRTSHLNDLYESTQTRWAAGPVALAAPAVDPETLPRGLLAPSPRAAADGALGSSISSSVSLNPHMSQPRGSQRGPAGSLDQAVAAAAVTLPHRGGTMGSGAAPGADAAGLPGSAYMALTPRSRMLSPSQVDSYLVSPSVTNSMAAVASIDGGLPASAGPGQQWLPRQSPLQSQPTWPQHRPGSPLRSMTSVDQPPVNRPLTTGNGAQPLAVSGRATTAVNSPAQLAAQPPPPQGRISATAETSPADAAAGPVSHRSMAAATPGAESSRAAAAAQPHARRPWFRWLLQPGWKKSRAGAGSAAGPVSVPAQDQSAAAAAAVSTSTGSPGRNLARSRSLSPLRPGGTGVMGPQAPGACPPAVGDRAVGRTSPRGRDNSAASGASQGTGGASPGASPSSRSGVAKGGGRGGKGRLLRSALVHLGVWTGGVTVGVLLVLGLAGVVEGTLGVGGGALGAGRDRDRDPLCSCPPPAANPAKALGEEDGHSTRRCPRPTGVGSATPR